MIAQLPYLLDQTPQLLIAQFCVAFIREQLLIESGVNDHPLWLQKCKTSLDSVILTLSFEIQGLFTCTCAT